MILILASTVGLSLASMTFAQADGGDQAGSSGGKPTPAEKSRASTPANPNFWPQDITTNGRTYRIFQPRVTGIDGARAYLVTEVSMTDADGNAVTGEAHLRAEVHPGDVPGELEINQFSVDSLSFGSTAATDADRTALSQALFVVAITTTRPTLLQDMRLVNPRGASTPGLCSEAPAIVVRQQPTVLVSVDGAPRLAPLGDTGWKTVSNTPFVLLQAKDGAWWTRVGGKWQTAASIDGTFAAAKSAPPADVVSAIGDPASLPDDVASMPPIVQAPELHFAAAMVATKPTVLVATDGAPVLADACPGVQQVTNTNSVLLTLDGKAFFVLASGRWFSAPDLAGSAWKLVDAAAVPQAFADLPRTKRFDGARAAVPGTPEANEAVLASREIRTVTLKRAGAQPDFAVAGGMPQDDAAWRPVDGTPVQWLPGASQPVLRAGGTVYCCDSGAWFSAPKLAGPWSLCERVPDSIYAIPPSNPVYPCTYVWVFGSTPDTVTFGFSPGYLGTYLVDGTPVFGTGFAYAHPASAPYAAAPVTYGADPSYDAQTGTFSPPDDPNDAYAYYGGADVNPAYLSGYGWAGWGWCPGWTIGWGYGWNNWWGWNHWGWWANHWHPYYHRWASNFADWEKQDLRDARSRLSQRTKPLEQRSWAPARGQMAKAGSADIRSAGTADNARRRDQQRDISPEAARENQAAIDRQFAGAAQDAPAAFRGEGLTYGGYPAEAYRPWGGDGSNLGGNWGYSPLAAPNGFHPPQQFVDPGAYWGAGTHLGNAVGPNAGPYRSPEGHGGWGTYDHWAGEGVRGTEYGGRGGRR